MKKVTAMILTASLALSLTACGGKETTVTVDTSKLATELQSTVTSDTLSESATEMIPATYFLSDFDLESSVAYASSGATACEIVVIQAKDEKDTTEIEKKLQTRVDNQSDLYASYNQGEVEKLDKAIIKSAGAYTVLCVCDDTAKAEEILKGYGF